MGKVIRRGEEARRLAVNILRNGGTIDDAAMETGYGRDYVRQLGAKEGIRFSRGKYGPHKSFKFDRDLIISLYQAGASVKEAAKIVGCSESYISNTWRKAGFKKQLTPIQRKIKSLREDGLVCVEIADLIGMPSSNVRNVAIAIGMPFTEEEKARSIAIGLAKGYATQFGDTKKRIDKSREFIEKNHPEWIYIDGLTGGEGIVRLKCKACGSIVEKSANTVRHKETKMICPECSKAVLLNKEREREENRKKQEEERAEKKRAAFWSQEFPQMSFSECAQCGCLFFGKGKYCSDKCRKKAVNRAGDHRLERAEIIDKTITLEKLYFRDKGKCWICGGDCDYSDHRIDSFGNFIVGKNYPTIDHVYPLSKGGNHTWDNVKLAHHICNTIKNAKVVS